MPRDQQPPKRWEQVLQIPELGVLPTVPLTLLYFDDFDLQMMTMGWQEVFKHVQGNFFNKWLAMSHHASDKVSPEHGTPAATCERQPERCDAPIAS